MSAVQSNRDTKKKSDILFIILSILVLVLALYFVPDVLSATGVSFLSVGSGLNKLLSVIISAALSLLVLMPSGFFKRSMDLAKGARVEWSKTIKPGRDQVVRTTLMVFVIVVIAAIIIYLMDGILFTLYNSLLG